jgi:hypothetical protein
VHERDFRGTIIMTSELLARMKRYLMRIALPDNAAIRNLDPTEAKTTAVGRKCRQVIGFD